MEIVTDRISVKELEETALSAQVPEIAPTNLVLRHPKTFFQAPGGGSTPVARRLLEIGLDRAKAELQKKPDARVHIVVKTHGAGTPPATLWDLPPTLMHEGLGRPNPELDPYRPELTRIFSPWHIHMNEMFSLEGCGFSGGLPFGLEDKQRENVLAAISYARSLGIEPNVHQIKTITGKFLDNGMGIYSRFSYGLNVGQALHNVDNSLDPKEGDYKYGVFRPTGANLTTEQLGEYYQEQFGPDDIVVGIDCVDPRNEGTPTSNQNLDIYEFRDRAMAALPWWKKALGGRYSVRDAVWGMRHTESSLGVFMTTKACDNVESSPIYKIARYLSSRDSFISYPPPFHGRIEAEWLAKMTNSIDREIFWSEQMIVNIPDEYFTKRADIIALAEPTQQLVQNLNLEFHRNPAGDAQNYIGIDGQPVFIDKDPGLIFISNYDAALALGELYTGLPGEFDPNTYFYDPNPAHRQRWGSGMPLAPFGYAV